MMQQIDILSNFNKFKLNKIIKLNHKKTISNTRKLKYQKLKIL